jgi:serine-type D-Ala-D-Ala carboxypeptidase (penicillin-binding protein 5/6)
MKPVAYIAAALALAASPVAILAAMPTVQSAAPIAYLYDVSAGAILFSKDADRRIPPASMAKMMTTHVVFDLIKSGKLKLDQKFTVRPETWAKWHGPAAGSTMFLAAGEQVSVENLLNGVVTLSGNDACVVLAEGIAGTEQAFVGMMNEKAKQLGMANSQFGTSNGWPDAGRTFVTAKDLAKLGITTIERYPDLYQKFYGLKAFTWGKTNGGGAITQANRNPILGKIDGADGMKTGHTDEAGYGFVGAAVQNGRRLVMVVAGIDSFNNRIAESVKLMDWGFKAWSTKPLFPQGKVVGSADVQQGSASQVDLVAPRALGAAIPIGTNPKLALSIAYNGPILAPLRKGDHVADLVVRVPGGGIQRMPLVAATDVARAGFLRSAWLGALSLFGV